jgi:ParB/RepB/Spo0J family partition protein
MEKHIEGDVTLIKVSDIYVAVRMRGVVKSVDDLIGSIPIVGLIHPIVVKEINTEEYKYELVAGERRLTAHIELKYEYIRATIASKEQAKLAKFIELVENKNREDFTPLEDILQTNILHEDFVEAAKKEGLKHTITATSKKFGVNRGYLSETLRLARVYLNACNKIREHDNDATKEKPSDYFWDKELIENFQKAKSRADLERVDRNHTLSYNTRNLANAVKEEVETRIREATEDVDEVEREDDPMPLWKKNVLKLVDQSYHIGDTIVKLKEFENNLASTCYWDIDPPYGVGYSNFVNTTKYHDVENFRQASSYYRKVIYEMGRISGPYSRAVIWHGAEPRYGTIVQRFLKNIGWRFDPIPFLWIKPRGNTKYRNLYIPRCYENATLAFAPEAEYYNNNFQQNWYECSTPSNQERFHPNAKPFELINFLFSNFFEFPSMAYWFIPFCGGGAAVYKSAKSVPIGLYTADLEEHYKNELLLSIRNDIFENKNITIAQEPQTVGGIDEL